MRYTAAEAETIVLFNEESKLASIYSHNSKLKAQIARYIKQCPDMVTEKHCDDETGAFACVMPKSALQILKTPRTEKQIAAGRLNVQKARLARNPSKPKG